MCAFYIHVVCHEWIVQDFDRQIQDKAAGETQVLLDATVPYPELLALPGRITSLFLVPSSLHACTASLDVVCFAWMKEAWKEEINVFELRMGRAVKKGDFRKSLERHFKAFMPEIVQAAFRATGIYPFNPDVITEKQIKPSLVTSTKATFSLPSPPLSVG